MKKGINAGDRKDTSSSTPNDATFQRQIQRQLQELVEIANNSNLLLDNVLLNNNEHNKNTKEENDEETVKKSMFVLYIYFLYF